VIEENIKGSDTELIVNAPDITLDDTEDLNKFPPARSLII
ncbi:17269_t:CDS:1, partial [Funneliformis caledonium]